MIGLVELHFDSESAGHLCKTVIQVSQRLIAINRGFANAQTIEIGTINDNNTFHNISRNEGCLRMNRASNQSGQG